MKSTRGRRALRVHVLAVACLVGGIGGIAVGSTGSLSAEEVAQRNGAAVSGGDALVSAQVDRALQELWRMEDVEWARAAYPGPLGLRP